MTNPSSTALQGSISNNQINFIGGIGSGPLVFNQAGQLTATLSGSGVSTTMTLANTQNGSGLFTPKFAGAFYGVYTGGDTGTMTLIIDGTGDVYGIISNISPNFTSALKGSISSAGALQLNQTNGSGTVTGTVAVGQADLTGSLDDEGNTVSVTLVQQQ
jgi:predicted Rossmann-fold nucleotide-binding protein